MRVQNSRAQRTVDQSRCSEALARVMGVARASTPTPRRRLVAHRLDGRCRRQSRGDRYLCLRVQSRCRQCIGRRTERADQDVTGRSLLSRGPRLRDYFAHKAGRVRQGMSTVSAPQKADLAH
jgi:hypothetical protein